jgi:endoglucanase
MNQMIKIFLLLLFLPLFTFAQTGAIHINQLGYYPEANKVAVVAYANASTFKVINVSDEKVEFSGTLTATKYWKEAEDSVQLADFSAFKKPGTYRLHVDGFGDSYPFEISPVILRKAAYASMKSFYYQRCSYELTAQFAGLWARKAGHPDDNCQFHSSTGKTGSHASPGGWYDAGDFGKYVINAGISVHTLLSFHENFPDFFADGALKIPESGNGISDLLDEVKYELDWLKTMQDVDGGVFFKLTTLQFAGMIMPDKGTATRYIIGKATASALDFAAMMAMAGRIYAPYDTAYADDCIVRAEQAWKWALEHPAIYFSNPAGVGTGVYGDSNVSDEFLWAASELLITTGKEAYQNYLTSRSNNMNYWSAPGWPNVQQLGTLSLLTRPNSLPQSMLDGMKASLLSTCDKWIGQIGNSAARIPQFGFHWGSNSGIANIGVAMVYAYQLTNDAKYIRGAAECADYLLGKNATGYSFVSGFGSRTPMNFHHRAFSADGIVQPAPGFVAGGPNSGMQDGEVYPFSAQAKAFTDVVGSYASNEVCINWNSPLTALLAGIDAVLGDGSAVDFAVAHSANNPPSLTFSAPSNNRSLGSNVPLTVRWSSADPDGVAKAEIYIDSRYQATVSETPFEWTTDAPAIGNHTITILSTDNKGLTFGRTNVFNIYDATSVDMLDRDIALERLKILSNEVQHQLTIEYRLPERAPAVLQLYDMNGRWLSDHFIEEPAMPKGTSIVPLNTPLPAGMYQLILRQNGKLIAATKLIKNASK